MSYRAAKGAQSRFRIPDDAKAVVNDPGCRKQLGRADLSPCHQKCNKLKRAPCNIFDPAAPRSAAVAQNSETFDYFRAVATALVIEIGDGIAQQTLSRVLRSDLISGSAASIFIVASKTSAAALLEGALMR